MGCGGRGMAGVLAATAIVGKPNSVRSKVCCGYQRMLERAVVLSCQMFSYWC